MNNRPQHTMLKREFGIFGATMMGLGLLGPIFLLASALMSMVIAIYILISPHAGIAAYFPHKG